MRAKKAILDIAIVISKYPRKERKFRKPDI